MYSSNVLRILSFPSSDNFPVQRWYRRSLGIMDRTSIYNFKFYLSWLASCLLLFFSVFLLVLAFHISPTDAQCIRHNFVWSPGLDKVKYHWETWSRRRSEKLSNRILLGFITLYIFRMQYSQPSCTSAIQTSLMYMDYSDNFFSC